MRYIIYTLSAFLLLGCGPGDHMNETSMETETVTVNTNILYYGDIINNSVVALDLTLMHPINTIDSNGDYPYEIAQALNNELYVLNRKDYTIGILDPISNRITGEVNLDFYPRSVKINQNDILLTSANEPAAAVINSNTASPSYADSGYIEPVSYGGSNATGHPVWVNDDQFLLLDRTENSIELYEKGSFQPIDKLKTRSSVHHVIDKHGIFYGICEGEQNGVSPGILKFTVNHGKIIVIQEKLLSQLSDLPDDFIAATWGAHHGAFHPTQDYIYIGSAEGNVFVLDLENLELADTFKTGKGVGHFTFYGTMLITTNHYDTFKSFYDASNPQQHILLKNISFSEQISSGITMQSHTSHIIDNKLYFMFNTDKESTLYEVNLDLLSIERSVSMVNNYCLMGTLVSDSVTTSSGM